MDYTKFADHYSELKEQGRDATWICKPTDMSRGATLGLELVLTRMSLTWVRGAEPRCCRS
jgi:hypothetical protein